MQFETKGKLPPESMIRPETKLLPEKISMAARYDEYAPFIHGERGFIFFSDFFLFQQKKY
jgi:hypothetical protein